jgi:CRP-like cAMP-binding protein
MFVLFSGHVHLLKLGPQGQQSIVAEIEPVIMFNEVTVLDGEANLTTAIAVQECVTWNISHADFQALVQRYPMIGLGLLRVLAARTRNLMAQYEDLSFRSILARTAKPLLDLSARGTRPIQRKEYPNADLAAHISTVPEALSRSLQVFRKNGDITCTRATITVNQPETLEKFAQVEKSLFKG